MSAPFGIHRITDLYNPAMSAHTPTGWKMAVARPYPGQRLRAAWWVLTGRAYAFQWPKDGDLESITQDATTPARNTSQIGEG